MRNDHQKRPRAVMTHTLESSDEDLKAATIKCSSKLLQMLMEGKKRSLSKGKVIEIQEHVDNKQRETETVNSKTALTLNLKITFDD